MNREIKFRTWSKEENRYVEFNAINFDNHISVCYTSFEDIWTQDVELEQFTGLHDKNGKGLQELYEGDIIDSRGKLYANIHEGVNRRESDLIIEGMGTKKWRDTEQEAVRRGWGYAE